MGHITFTYKAKQENKKGNINENIKIVFKQ